MSSLAQLRTVGKLARARERFARWRGLDVAAELRRVFERATDADRLEALAAWLELAERLPSEGERRRAIMAWLKAGAVDDFSQHGEQYTAAEGQRALAAAPRGGVAAAGAQLTGERADQFFDAQRNGSRGKARNVCRQRKRP